jgi:NADPH-dependent 2,4-dienoyl-CoA reductase/sulfur reductase-like enzyme
LGREGDLAAFFVSPSRRRIVEINRVRNSLFATINPAVMVDPNPNACDKLLLARGAEAIRLSISGADQPHIPTLRPLADSRAIIEAAKGARRALVVGASFIGMEAVAALRARKIEVHVAAPENRPMERVLGHEIRDFVRPLHEEHGVILHLDPRKRGQNGALRETHRQKSEDAARRAASDVSPALD